MIIFCIIFGVLSVILGFWVGTHADKISRLLCGGFTAWFGAIIVFFGFWLASSTTYYLEAEPLAYNYEANLTYFTSAEGQFKAEGIYPENTYLLTMDNNGTSDKVDDIVLVIWEPSEGEVG